MTVKKKMLRFLALLVGNIVLWALPLVMYVEKPQLSKFILPYCVVGVLVSIASAVVLVQIENSKMTGDRERPIHKSAAGVIALAILIPFLLSASYPMEGVAILITGCVFIFSLGLVFLLPPKGQLWLYSGGGIANVSERTKRMLLGNSYQIEEQGEREGYLKIPKLLLTVIGISVFVIPKLIPTSIELGVMRLLSLSMVCLLSIGIGFAIKRRRFNKAYPPTAEAEKVEAEPLPAIAPVPTEMSQQMPPAPRPRRQIRIPLFLVYFVVALIVFNVIQRCSPTTDKKASDPEISVSPTPTEEPVAHAEISPVVLLPAVITEKMKTKRATIDASKMDYEFDCQPDFFDPKVSKFSKVKQPDVVPSELYKIQGEDYATMMIDGWYKEGEYKDLLPEPFDVTVYHFGCASTFSYVIDLSKNGNRQALYTHIDHYSFSKDGKKLYLVNYVRDNNLWVSHSRIIDLETNTATELPEMDCVYGQEIQNANWGLWSGNYLLTYDGPSDPHACVWDQAGKLISIISLANQWRAASIDYMAEEEIGFLPEDDNIFYSYTSKSANFESPEHSVCSVILTNIHTGTTRTIDIVNRNDYPAQDDDDPVSLDYCGGEFSYLSTINAEFDFSNLYFDHGTLKYRLGTYNRKDNKVLWNDWQTITVQ